MIFNARTVLVLGAGASVPYGFPLGLDLKKMIIQNTASPLTRQGKQLVEAGFTEKDINAFHVDLVRSIHPTIDAFLEDRPSRRDLGTLAIAQVLMPLEQEDKLYPHHNWYQALFKELNLRECAQPCNVSAIVTMNYDRSIEHYLAETARRTYEGERLGKALDKLAHVPILHVHGQIGAYPEVGYVKRRSAEDFRNGAKGISLVHDQHLDESEIFKEAAMFISEASYVLFLGFGYDERTLRRLRVFDNLNGPEFYGTSYNIARDQRAEIKALFNDNIRLDDKNNAVDNYLQNFEKQMKERKQREKVAFLLKSKKDRVDTAKKNENNE